MWALMVWILILGGCSSGGESPGIVPTNIKAADPPSRSPSPSPAPLRQWEVQGTLADGGTVLGTFSTLPHPDPVGQDVRGLSPNIVWPVEAWQVEVHQHTVGPEVVEFVQGAPGHSLELCVGQCVFASGQTETLILKNGRQTLVVAFILPETLDHPPGIIEEWGAPRLDIAKLESHDAQGQFQFVELWHSETIAVVEEGQP